MISGISRRAFLSSVAQSAAVTAWALDRPADSPRMAGSPPPNILFIMTDQQRADSIAALGNADIYTPNLDRLVRRGVAFTRAYSACPVCVPARYTIRTGCDAPLTAIYQNGPPDLVPGQPENMEERCGPYLARTLRNAGYRTFGIGKFHTQPWDEDLGFDVHLHSEELYGSPDQRARDAYAAFIAREHPAFDYIEMLMGERTEMYYMPQVSPMPADITVEAWAAAQAVDQIQLSQAQPFFGFVSLIGPHPPLAPPLPFNRMYDPDRMPNPIRGTLENDHQDEQIPWMNHAIWAEDINDSHARVLRARYYGEISYIDQCIGRILDAVDARSDADNTLICFFADHGDHLGDHNAWQKESFFEASCHIPFLVSWPNRLPKNTLREDLVGLADLFGIATSAAGHHELRQGCDVLGCINGNAASRDYFFGYYGVPGTPRFKIMVRDKIWKFIFMANGGREQLFNLQEDPHELNPCNSTQPEVIQRLRAAAIQAASAPNVNRAVEKGSLKSFPFEARPLQRIYQFDHSRGVSGFPQKPQDALRP